MPIAHIYNGELGFDVRTKLNALIDQVASIPTGGAGTGDVVGPASAIADHIATYNGTTGKLIKDSGQSFSSLSFTSSQISDFAESTDDRIAALLVAGANVTLTYNDPANTLTIASTGGGGGMAIGGSITSATAASVLFAGPAGVLAQDNVNFWFNDTLNDLHIGGAYYIGSTARAVYVVPNVTENNWFEGNAGNQTVTGYGNFGTGDSALSLVTSGSSNAAMGTAALEKLTSASHNIAMGSFALQHTQSDDTNIAIGAHALQWLGNAGAGGGGNINNVVLGTNGLAGAEIAYANVLIGANTMINTYPPNVANTNVIIGFNAAASFGYGGGNTNDNTIIGPRAADRLVGASSANTFIGGWRGVPGGVTMSSCVALSEGSANEYTLLDWGITKPNTWSMAAYGSIYQTGLHIYNKQDALGVAVNFERGILDWWPAANVFTIGTQAGGTGIVRPVNIIGSNLTFNGSSVGRILDGSGPPSDAIGSTGDYYVDDTGNQMYGPKVAPVYGPDQGAFPPAMTPATTGSGSYELGVRVTITAYGRITAVRYWRPSGTSQIDHTVRVWTTGGTPLGSGYVANDGGGSGWKQVALTTPVVVASGSSFVISTEFIGPHPRSSGFPVSNSGDVTATTSYYGGVGSFPPSVDGTVFFIDPVFQSSSPLWPMAVDGDVGGSMAIGGAITSATAGSVLFAGAAGILAQDNTNFFWDDALNDLHIGGAYYCLAARALYVVPNVTENNWFEGNAGNQTVTGYGNFGTGDNALKTVTTGYDNVAVGASSMRLLTSGYENFALGSNSLRFTQTDINNTAIGTNALQQLGNSGAGAGNNSGNVVIGYGSLGNAEQGAGNVALGYNAMSQIFPPNRADANTILGNQAATILGVGGGNISSNTFIGDHAAANVTHGSENTWLGRYRGPSSAGWARTIAISDGYPINVLDVDITSNAWSFGYRVPYGQPAAIHIYGYQDAPCSVANYERAILDWQLTSNVFRIGIQKGGTGTLRLIAIDGFAKAGAPAAGDLPASSFAVIDDTSGGATWLVYNKAGTIRKVQLT